MFTAVQAEVTGKAIEGLFVAGCGIRLLSWAKI